MASGMKKEHQDRLKVGDRVKHYIFGTCTVTEMDPKVGPLLKPDSEQGRTLMLSMSGRRDGTLSDLPQTMKMARVCRQCGCAEDDACVHPEHGACWWVEQDLCSHCIECPGEAKRHSVIAAEEEARHFTLCGTCGAPIDMRDLSQVAAHEHDRNINLPRGKKYNSKRRGTNKEQLKDGTNVNLN